MELQSFARFDQRDPGFWPELSSILEQRFVKETSAHWLSLLEPLDACISAVLTLQNKACPQLNSK